MSDPSSDIHEGFVNIRAYSTGSHFRLQREDTWWQVDTAHRQRLIRSGPQPPRVLIQPALFASCVRE
jgi:hypothetical protein